MRTQIVFPNAIRATARSKKITMREISKRSDVPEARLHHIASKGLMVTVPTMCAIAAALGESPEDVFDLAYVTSEILEPPKPESVS